MASTRASPSPITAPFSIRLTKDERTDLASRAGNRPIGAYVKSVLFPDGGPTRRSPARVAHESQKELGKILAALGASRLASNFNQLAKAANQGALPVTQELENELWAACAQIAEMRDQLLAALGIRSVNQNLVQTFNRHAKSRGVL
ncbi:MAG: hypothetical protein J0H78_12930 [Rhizobiales bacterium]|nr:hypothetical protein [Hyphomicrobiales bacterium]OJY43534.1 MAG: hypothetical protein BGP08_01275 [Rhizobiales bacterium 64-17]